MVQNNFLSMFSLKPSHHDIYLNLIRKVNDERKALGADDDSSYPSVMTHAILKLHRNDKVSTGAGGSHYNGGFDSSDYRHYQTFEGILLKRL